MTNVAYETVLPGRHQIGMVGAIRLERCADEGWNTRAASSEYAVAANHDLDYTPRIGAKASEPALNELLRSNDLVRIACRGRLDPAANAFELMVAANGELPPRTLIEQDKPSVRANRLDRKRLQALTGIAPYVVSSACCSGAAVFTEGGERIGLERALYIAGAVAFVAPQWDVHAGEMRDQLAAVLDTWFNNEAAGLELIRFTDNRN